MYIDGPTEFNHFSAIGGMHGQVIEAIEIDHVLFV